MSQKIGRNDTCVCGSGKKYKKCCLHISDPNEGMQSLVQYAENVFPNAHISKFDENSPYKMSEVLLEFGDDILDSADSEEKEAAIGFCAMAWNLSFFSPEIRQEKFKEFLKKATKGANDSDKEEFKEMFELLVERREKHYPPLKYNRIILSFNITGKGDNMRFNVMSNPIKVSDDGTFLESLPHTFLGN